MPELPDSLSPNAVLAAVESINAGKPHAFADSTGYDIIVDGDRYPPKAVVGVAAEIDTGQAYGPKDFSGGLSSKCFRLLRDAGFKTVEKGAPSGYEYEDRVEQAFHEEMFSLFARTGFATGGAYWPRRFRQSVIKHGGLARAKALLASNVNSDGFKRLAEVRRADLSVEAIALTPQFSALFTEEELETARTRLNELPPEAFPTESGKPAERLADELPDKVFTEGAARKITVNSYERDPKAREACLKYFGAICQVCGLNFAERYGEDLGGGFIHVHHKRPIHTLKASYKVDPKKDLVPVCPNCHAMLHRKEPPLDVEQLQARLNAQRI